jgi:hypothetical protein
VDTTKLHIMDNEASAVIKAALLQAQDKISTRSPTFIDEIH